MKVRMKIGPKSGKMVDLPYAAARNLVEMDQAEDVHDEMRLPKAKIERIDAVSVEGRNIPTTAVETSAKKKARR